MTPAAPASERRATPLFDGADWDYSTLNQTYEAIEEIALEDLGLDVYPNQIEIISTEQMLDAYCSIGMPLIYEHWSFGKRFVIEEELYRKGRQGLAARSECSFQLSYCPRLSRSRTRNRASATGKSARSSALGSFPDSR